MQRDDGDTKGRMRSYTTFQNVLPFAAKLSPTWRRRTTSLVARRLFILASLLLLRFSEKPSAMARTNTLQEGYGDGSDDLGAGNVFARRGRDAA